MPRALASRSTTPIAVDTVASGPAEPARNWFHQPPRLRLVEPVNQGRLTRWSRALGDGSVREAMLRGYQLPQGYRAGYYERRVYPYLDRPSFRPGTDPHVYHRGMYLTLDELQNILRNGLEVSRTSWHAGGASGVSFSSSQQEAVTYIFQTPRAVQGIGVVVVVRDDEQVEPCPAGETNPCGTIFHSDADVRPGKIIDICIWGRWGLEGLDDVLARISSGEVVPHTDWTSDFDR